MPYPFPDSSVPPPPLKKKGRTMPPDDPNDTAGMMEWLKQVPPPNTSWPVPLGTDDHKGPVAGPFTKVEGIQAPAPKMPVAPSPLGVGAGRVKELDDLLMRRIADTAPTPAPQSPLERQVLDPNDARNFAPVRMIKRNKAGYADDAGNFVYGAAPQKMRPEDVAFARAMEAHQIDAAQKMAQRQALTGAMEVAPKMLPAEAEASKNAFLQSPKGMMQGIVGGIINAGGTPDQVALMMPQLERMVAGLGGTPGTQEAGPPLPADPIAGMGQVNPRLFSTVYDPKTGKKTADADSVEKFMDQVMAVDGGKMLEQNFPAIQAYANAVYGPNAISNAVSSPKSIQALERYNPVSRLVGPLSVLGKVPSVFENLPKSPVAGYREAEAIAREADMQRQQRAQVPLQERLWEGLGLNPAQAQRNQAFREAIRRYLASAPAASGQPTGQPPPLPKR